MDNTANNLDPERLAALARAHYNAARWDDALSALGQIQALGYSSPELDDLVGDIKLKQRLDEMPVAAKPTPRPRRNLALPLLAAGGVVALLAASIIALGPLLNSAAAQPVVEQLNRGVAAALPTAAPTTAPTTAPTAAVAEPVRLGALTVEGLSGAVPVVGVSNVYFILDASGSMLARVNGERKIDIAQQALTGLVRELPEGTQVALRTYGRRRANDCGDVELLAQPGPLYREGLIAQIEAIEPVNLSRTPIGASLQATAQDLAAMPGQTLVVLVSDGDESCEGDAIAAAAAIHQARPDVRVSVVGFDIAPQLREKLATIAQAGGGIYVDAGSIGELQAALDRVVAVNYRVLDAAGSEVATGQLGESVELPGGSYTVVIGDNPVLFQEQVDVRDGQLTSVTLGGDGSALSAQIRHDPRP